MKKKILYKSLTLMKRLQDPYYHGAAAEMGFYLLFSIVPIITILSQILGYAGVTEFYPALLNSAFAGNSFLSSFLSSFEQTLSGGLNLVFIAGALWAASKIEFSLIRISNYTYRLDSGGYVKVRLRAVFTVALLILLIFSSLVILVYGNSILSLATSALDHYLGIDFHIDEIYMFLRWPLAFVVFSFLIAANYSILPDTKVPLKKTLPGSLFSSVGIIAASLGYQVYFSYFSNFNVLYGSLAAIIALLLWFYLLSYILLVGLVLNAVWFDE